MGTKYDNHSNQVLKFPHKTKIGFKYKTYGGENITDEHLLF